MMNLSYYVGGDVSKGYCDFVILDQHKQVIEPNFQLDDTPTGHQELSRVLMAVRKTNPQAPIYVGMESTGGYENNWYYLLWNLKDNLNLYVARLNPLAVKHHKIASMQRNDTDKISARKIADYLIAYPEVPNYNQEDPFSPLRRQWKFIRLLKKQKAQLKKQLESLIYVAHPQMIKYWDEDLSEWFLQVLIRCPTAQKLAHARVKQIAAIRYVTEEKAKELIQDARASVASATEPWIAYSVESLAGQILTQKKTIDKLEKEMLESYTFPEVQLLNSFKGIGPFSAFGLMIEIGSIDRYASVKNLVSFFGLHPVLKESGDGKVVPRMSKKGRKEPRWILYNVTMSAINCNEMIKTLYEGYLKEGKVKMVAIGIMMHKILRIIYGMLKHNCKYDPKIDQANRTKKFTNKKRADKAKTDRSRRYQDYDPNAPISNRQTKKRKQSNSTENISRTNTITQKDKDEKTKTREKTNGDKSTFLKKMPSTY